MSETVTMLTTAAISKALNVNRQRVHQLARARGVEPTAKVGGVCLWPADAIERLRPRATGYRGHAKRTVTGTDA